MNKNMRLAVTISSILIAFAGISTMYTNCGQARIGVMNDGAGGPAASLNEGQSIATTGSSCPAQQVAIGLAPDHSTVLCAPLETAPQTTCPTNSSVYILSGDSVQCVANSTYSQPGSLCPVGQFLVGYTTLGAISCLPSTAVEPACPAGQYASGVTQGSPSCLPVPASIPNAQICPAGQFAFDVIGGALSCHDLLWPATTGQTCPTGTFALGWLNGQLLCQTNVFNTPGVTTNCPSGQILLSYLNNTAQCTLPPNPDLSHACSDGFNVAAITNSGISCQASGPGGGPQCPSGQFFVGITAGTPVCAVVPANHLPTACPISNYPVGISNGATVCTGFTGLNYGGSAMKCPPGTNSYCSIPGGLGQQTCSVDGQSQSTCKPVLCNPGYKLNATTCDALACMPGQAQACPVTNGIGQQFCSTAGTWGTCQLQSCQNGYIDINGLCVTEACVPGTAQACTSGLGHGTQTCSVDGAGYGACVINMCPNGYTLKGGACLDTTPPLVTFQQSPANPTLGMTATAAFTVSDGQSGVASVSCALDSAPAKPCTSPVTFANLSATSHTFVVTAVDQAGNTGTGTISWVNEVCSPTISTSCPITNGLGHQVCSSTGVWGACTPISCSSGYQLQNNACVSMTCGAGFTSSGGTCVDKTAPTLVFITKPTDPTIGHSASLTFSAQDTGSGVASMSCSLDTNKAAACTSPVSLSNLSFGSHTFSITAMDVAGNTTSISTKWRNFDCTPGTTTNCPITNGAGTAICLADGSGNGACVATSCNEGFEIRCAACVAKKNSRGDDGGKGRGDADDRPKNDHDDDKDRK